MSLTELFRPREALTEEEVQAGLFRLTIDGMCAQVMVVLTSGAFLVAFLLLLGASNVMIGLAAAIGPLCQLLQVPSIALINRIRWRKAVTVAAVVPCRLVWLPIALAPFVLPEPLRLPAVFLGLFVFFGFANLAGAGWNSWMRDLVPDDVMGRFFGRRMALMTTVGALMTLAGGIAVDQMESYAPDGVVVYSVLFAIAALFGGVGLPFLAHVPEPATAPSPTEMGLWRSLREPLHDANFRKLLVFMAVWSFAMNLSIPFFAVYMLKRLGMGMGLILALSVLSQFVNVLFFRVWGKLADLLSNKSVLSVCGSLFVITIGLFPFTTLPDKHVMTLPIVVLIHVLGGVSMAGIALCAGNIALKLSPRGKATSYLAVNAVLGGVTATLAPILAGLAADWFAGQTLSVHCFWKIEEVGEFASPVLVLQGLDFVFGLSVLLGLFALGRLAAVREKGEVTERIVMSRLYDEMRLAVRNISSLGGVRYFTYLPYALLRRRRRSQGKGNPEEPGPTAPGSAEADPARADIGG